MWCMFLIYYFTILTQWISPSFRRPSRNYEYAFLILFQEWQSQFLYIPPPSQSACGYLLITTDSSNSHRHRIWSSYRECSLRGFLYITTCQRGNNWREITKKKELQSEHWSEHQCKHWFIDRSNQTFVFLSLNNLLKHAVPWQCAGKYLPVW